MPCTTILCGRNATNDGSTIISRNDDGMFEAKKVIVTEPAKQPKKYKSVIAHLEIELPDNPLRYTSVPNVEKKNGVWPATGINSANVAMTATETITSNPRVLGADPLVKYKEEKGKKIPGGIGEEDLVTIVLPYIRTAREGVIRLGGLLEKYGTYESNGIAFSDENEIWWLETIGGHHWIARRVPDDRVVIMPNQFGLDNFDFSDAYGEKKENLCSGDLLGFVEKNHLNTGKGDVFNPRLAFGSCADSDHIYNTPRAWYMAGYLAPSSYKNDSYGPESNDLPWSLIPENKVTVEDVRYLLGSYYQGTPYNPYDGKSPLAGKYRSIGVPNSDVCGIMQIRPGKPDLIKGVEWLSLGGSGFTCCFPVYSNVGKFPKYFGGTTEDVSTDSMYWSSRILAALIDAHYGSAIIHDERYTDSVLNSCREILNRFDSEIAEKNDASLLEKANEEIAKTVRKETEKALSNVLLNASQHMKTRYHRNDN